MLHHLRFHLCFLCVASLSLLAHGPSMSRADDAQPPRRLLFFHRSAGFQHSVVEAKGGKRCYAEMMQVTG